MTLWRMMLLSATLLGIFAIITTGGIALTEANTRERIAQREQQILQDKLNKLISADQYDNDLAKDVITVTDSRLGSSKPQIIYRARKSNQPVACIISSIAPDGYSGSIELLVAVRFDGALLGVRVIRHRETPGLGDPIEENKSRWIFQFDGKSLQQPPPDKWKVRKDKGEFDQLTSATITSRAVVKAIYNTLQFHAQQRDSIYSAPAMSGKP